MTSVAYRVEPPAPGWLWTAGGLVVGWIVAGAAIAVLYVVASLVGAISRTYPSYPGALNDWPYPDHGLWSLAANIAVVLLGVVLTTVATSWWMRGSYERFSEGRLALVLLLTGWLPFESGHRAGGFLGFVIALVLIRYWVARHEDHLPWRTAIVLVAALVGVIGVYGLLHPLWTVNVVETGRASARTNTIVIHNAAHVPVRVDAFQVTPSVGVVRPSSTDRAFRFAAGSDRVLVQSLARVSGCGTLMLGIHVRYHVFGLALHQTVPARVPLGRPC